MQRLAFSQHTTRSFVLQEYPLAPPNSNVDAFNLICIGLLTQLYESFPVPIAIDPNHVALTSIPNSSDYDSSWSAMQISVETIVFLRQEGFLTAGEPVATGEVPDVRLTMKGLAVLGSVPVSLVPLETPEPLIEKMRRVVGKGAEKLGAQAIQAIVSTVFKYALSSTPATAEGIPYI